jgi:hypothetical protein
MSDAVAVAEVAYEAALLQFQPVISSEELLVGGMTAELR